MFFEVAHLLPFDLRAIKSEKRLVGFSVISISFIMQYIVCPRAGARGHNFLLLLLLLVWNLGLAQVYIFSHSTCNFVCAAAGCPWMEALFLAWVHDVSCSESCKHSRRAMSKGIKGNIQYIKEIKRTDGALCNYKTPYKSLLSVLLLEGMSNHLESLLSNHCSGLLVFIFTWISR